MRKKITKTKLLQIRKDWVNPLENKVFGEEYVRSAFTRLSPRACHLYLYISHGVDRDLIFVDRHQYLSDAGIATVEPFVGAISELCAALIMVKAPKMTDVFFLNPHIFFKDNTPMKYKVILSINKYNDARMAKREAWLAKYHPEKN